MSARKNRKLPDWYPLDTYTRELTDDEWATEIYLRIGFAQAYHNVTSGKYPGLTFDQAPDVTFLHVIRPESPRPGKGFIDDDDLSYHVWPVREMSWFEAEFLAHLARPHMTRSEKVWAKRLALQPKKWLGQYWASGAGKKIRSQKDHLHGSYPGRLETKSLLHLDVLGPLLPVMINVNLDDETLRKTFDLWLARIRKGSGAQEKPIDDKMIAKWRRFGVLQAFDLNMWGKVTNKPYTDVFIAHVIWPDSEDADFVDKTERYRKVTKPLVRKVFSPWEGERLLHQLRVVRFLEKTFPKLLTKKSGMD